VFDAVSTWFSCAVPLIVTVPVGGSLTLVTAAVRRTGHALQRAIGRRFVYFATTSMVCPTSALPSV